MATRNPFAHDASRGEAWELGYLSGFAEPETDHFLPFSPELTDVYQRGELAGRDDRRRLPPDASGAEEGDGGEHGGHYWAAELAEHGIIHAIGVVLEKIGLRAGGLISLILTVVTIPGDVQLRPLEPDWEGPTDVEGDIYLALCPRTDHPMVAVGVTGDGYWAGPARTTFDEAFADRRVHQHAEAVVVRCSSTEGTCGAVWPVQ